MRDTHTPPRSVRDLDDAARAKAEALRDAVVAYGEASRAFGYTRGDGTSEMADQAFVDVLDRIDALVDVLDMIDALVDVLDMIDALVAH